MEEEFELIPEFSAYRINRKGQVLSSHVNKILKTYKNNKGRLCVKLHKEGVQYTLLVHRLLARVFLGLPSLQSTLEVDHIDNDFTNNDLENLQILDKMTHLDKTMSDRGLGRNTSTCLDCRAPLSSNKISRCKKCSILFYSKTSDLTEEKIVEVLTSVGSWVQASKVFGLSDNGLRKAYVRLSNGKDPKKVLKP